MKNIMITTALFATQFLTAQTPGSLDTGFVAPSSGFSDVWRLSSSAVLPDGKILVGGIVTLKRVQNNGLPDTSFSGSPTGETLDIELQPDGKILFSGSIQYNSVNINGIARVNSDGSIDNTFLGSQLDISGNIHDIQLQADGKIIIAGTFQKYNSPIKHIIRLNADGSLDSNFNSGNGVGAIPNSEGLAVVDKVALLSNGKIIIAGNFTRYNNIDCSKDIVRLNADGSLDTTFNAGTGFGNGEVMDISIQPDGKIIAAGSFTEFNGTSINRIVRLNADGSLDTTFNPNTGANNTINALGIQPDGKIIIVGKFDSYDGITRQKVARINSNGSLDTTFAVGYGANNEVTSVTLQPDGKIIITGYFTGYNNVSRYRIARLNGTNTMATEDFFTLNMKLYPNPVKDILNFSEEVLNIRITDISGRTVKEIPNSSKSVNLQNLSKGIYIFTATTKTGKSINQKIVKQ